jgi:hypothetical protein
MVHALAILAAAAPEGAAHESSKTAFYVLGALFAVWAVVLAAIGMSQATFPATATAKRGVMALSTVLMVGAMATAVITA